MSTLLILVLLILSVGFAFAKRTKACALTLVATIILFILIGDGLIPSFLLTQLQKQYVDMPQPEWKEKNAIVLLGVGAIKQNATGKISPTIMAYSRIYETARLYTACEKTHHHCTIVISGGDAFHVGSPEAAVYRDALLNLDIKKSDIKLEMHSMNTYKNAEFTSAILKSDQFDQVILVTSGVHLKRSLLYFSYFGINAVPSLADYLAPRFTFIPIGYNFAMTDFAIHEYVGIIRFYLYGWMGKNKIQPINER